ncbi:MAG: hypothetical protein M1426_05480, partial [Patescibacteria group bacterium]|nr:hypothetical protein [Patescibacteria group bacterium]
RTDPLQNISSQVWYEGKSKSMRNAVILTLLVPGAGEMYTGRIVRGLVFLGIEALGWTAYAHYNSKGDNIDAEFKRFADAHWDPAGYRTWAENYKAAHNGQLPDSYTHTLPDTKTQQYYEMIGKYDQFVKWWDDYKANVGAYGQSERRLYYMERRHQSNINYKRAMIAGMVIFAKRIGSLVDTIWGVKKQNAYQAQRWSWDYRHQQSYGNSVNYLTLGYHW